MATIKQRKTNFSVIYWYLNADGIRKQKWDTVSTRAEAKRRKDCYECSTFPPGRAGRLAVSRRVLIWSIGQRRLPDSACRCDAVWTISP